MGKHLQRQDSGFGSNHSGCMWSLIHILDHHRWNNVKQMLPHRKRSGDRRGRCDYGSRKTTSNNKKQELAVAEVEPLLVKQHSTETSSGKKRSGKSRIKASSAQEKTKEESPKSWILSFPVKSWLRRTNVVQDVQPSENCLQDSSPEKCEKDTESSANKKLMRRKKICSDQFNDHADILEIFKANKEFFLKILLDRDVKTNQFSGLQHSKNKVRLTKSRSFPEADSSRARYIRPKTLKHKQNEIWSFPKGEELPASTRKPKFVTSESQEDFSMKSKPYMASNDSVGSVMKQEKSSSLGLPEGFSNQGWNQLVINRFRDITQKLMHAVQESKKENVHPSIKALFHRDPSGCDGKELPQMPEIAMGQERNKVDGSDDNLGKQRLRRVRRTSSLDESLDRYTQLFEFSSSSDQSKWQRSGSLKLKSEEKVPSTGNAQKSTRRNLSMPDLDSFFPILNGAAKDAFRFGMPVRNIVDLNANKSEQLDAIVETEFQNNMVGTSDNRASNADKEDLHEYEVEPAIGESRTHQERGIVGITINPETELAQSTESSILEQKISACTASHAEASTSEGSQLTHRSPHVNQPDSSPDLQNKHSIDSLPESCNTASTEIDEHKSVDNHSSQFVVGKVDDPDSEFSYVKYVLELSGFIGHEDLGTWYSTDQPLDPTLFKELEACSEHEPELREDEQVTAGNLDHQLLFDLVNETLLEVYERSYTYFPRAFSSSGCIRPMPKGHSLLDEVWTRVSSYLSLRPEMDQSLDDVVARDLAKGDRWMNLQWETECVALELEDLIFDELLDEVLCV